MKSIIKAVDQLKREAVFICYEPETPDTDGEWMSKETVEAACQSFNKAMQDGVLIPNLFHDKDSETNTYTKTDAFSIQKSWVTPVECVIGETEVKEGTWLVKVKFENDVLWNAFEQGTVKGVSIGCKASVKARGKADA
jgi:hypothetical protein